MSGQYEITPNADPAYTDPVWADTVERTAYGVHFPYIGELWSYDKTALAAYLRAAADQVDAMTSHSTSPLAHHWNGQWHARCACGEVFSHVDQPHAYAARARHVQTVAGEQP
jgi:hypothetical protein